MRGFTLECVFSDGLHKPLPRLYILVMAARSYSTCLALSGGDDLFLSLSRSV